jgi:hypothetical protein
MDSTMDSEVPSLTPVFSVLVAGHRQQRLADNWFERGADPAVRRQALEHALEQALRVLQQSAARAFAAGEVLYAKQPPEYRLLTGVAGGTDQLARELAQPLGYQLQLMTAQAVGSEVPEPAERIVSLGGYPGNGEHELSREDYRLRDELLLSLADCLVAVWDEQEPEQISSGTASLIRAALLRRTPVLLLRLQPERDTPLVSMTQLLRLTDAYLLEIETLGERSARLLECFSSPQEDEWQARLDTWMETLLVPFLPALDQHSREHRYLARIEQQCSLLLYLWQWLIFWGSWGRCRRPLPLLEWLSGARLWLQVMFNPPRRSAPRRILDTLTRKPHAGSTGEKLARRAHQFFSSLARLQPRQALWALQPAPAGRSAYQRIRPDSHRHPIVEPGLESFFNWSDAQAQAFSTRHRDDIWMIYYAAAFAVFCAVAGTLKLWPANQSGLLMIWAVSEFVLLRFIVAHVLKARYNDWHGHWMSYRLIAEQLRYLRIGYPTLVLPKVFMQPCWSVHEQQGQRQIQLLSAEIWLLQRILIAEGLPRSRDRQRVYQLTDHTEAALEYLQEILQEHRQYFSRSFHNLHRDHIYLHRLAFGLFAITFVAVTVHFFVSISWILIFTAFFPAWGAAIHGILTHNEVVRMSAMAGSVWSKLTTLEEAADLYAGSLSQPVGTASEYWHRTRELRDLVQVLTRVLSDENQHWRTLLQHNHPDLPA